MPSPSFVQLSDEERSAALKKALAVRSARAAVLAQVRDGKLSCADIIAKASDSVYGKIKVEALIRCFKGYGKARAAQLMAEIGIAENRRVAGLGVRQAEALIKALDA